MPSIMDAFADLRDPRCRECRYPLEEILFTALCATLCGVEDWETIVLWGRTQLAWLRGHLPFANGIPCDDTFRRVFGRLSPVLFEQCFIEWVAHLCPSLAGQHVAIDGKTVRGNTGKGHGPLHLVSAWCSGNGLSLGQVATAEKSNEITAIPELLKALDLSGATVTIDAMGTQHEIAQAIIDGGADYVLMVKDNQPTLAESLRDWFASVQAGGLERPYWEHTAHDKGHGRIETRVCRVSDDVQWLAQMGQNWAGIQRIAMIERTRQIGERISVEQCYCISSRPVKAIEMLRLVRAHWGIENQLHWVLDVSWGEDAQQTRDKAAARNMATLRKITLNLARMAQQQQPKKVSLKNIRNLAAWDIVMRESILGLA
jgi:predicted transposase YbfD/YdcC